MVLLQLGLNIKTSNLRWLKPFLQCLYVYTVYEYLCVSCGTPSVLNLARNKTSSCNGVVMFVFWDQMTIYSDHWPKKSRMTFPPFRFRISHVWQHCWITVGSQDGDSATPLLCEILLSMWRRVLGESGWKIAKMVTWPHWELPRILGAQDLFEGIESLSYGWSTNPPRNTNPHQK